MKESVEKEWSDLVAMSLESIAAGDDLAADRATVWANKKITELESRLLRLNLPRSSSPE